MPKKLDILSPRPDKKHQECYKKIFSETNVKVSKVTREDYKPYWKSGKHNISLGDQQAYYLQVFQRSW